MLGYLDLVEKMVILFNFVLNVGVVQLMIYKIGEIMMILKKK